MNYCRPFIFLLLSSIGLISQPIALVADEPFSLQIELRNGLNGPKRAAVAVPGEYIYMAACLRGPNLEEAMELKLELRGEIRSETDELIKAVDKRQATPIKLIGTRQVTFHGGFSIPKDYEGKTIKHILFVRDVASGIEIKEEMVLTIRSPKTLHAFNAGYYLPDYNDVPASGRFVTGDNVRFGFYVGQIKDSKSVECKLEFIPTDKSAKLGELSQNFEIPRSKRQDNLLALRFDFPTDEPFEGKVRLTVVDNLKNSDSIELPLSITNALGSDEGTYVVERPVDESKATKKE